MAELIRSKVSLLALKQDGHSFGPVSSGVAARGPVFQAADQALSMAKRNGRNRVVAEPAQAPASQPILFAVGLHPTRQATAAKLDAECPGPTSSG